MSGTVQPRVQSSTIRSCRGESTARAGGFEDLAEFLTLAVAAVEVGAGGQLVVERLEAAGPLDPLADHVDRPDQLATLGGVVGQDEVEVELAGAGLAQQAGSRPPGCSRPRGRGRAGRSASRPAQ